MNPTRTRTETARRGRPASEQSGVVVDDRAPIPARGPNRSPSTPSGTLARLYRDPLRPLAFCPAELFDVLSVPQRLGDDALRALRKSGARLGPVLADRRERVRRVGFLLPPASTASTTDLWRWFKLTGRWRGARYATRGTVSVVSLPPLYSPAPQSLIWLVPPTGTPATWTGPDVLANALLRATWNLHV